MPSDTTKTTALEVIASKLEDKAGIPRPQQARDTEEVSKLVRIGDALDSFVGSIETHSLTEHTDVTLGAASVGEYLRFNGSVWINTPIPAGDIQELIGLPDLTDVADATVPTSGHFLRGDGAAWTNAAISVSDLPTLELDDLSDVQIIGPSDNQFLYFNGFTLKWNNKFPKLIDLIGRDHHNLTGLTDDDHPQYLLTNGGRALTGAWNAGDFVITSGGLRPSVNDSRDIGATTTGRWQNLYLTGFLTDDSNTVTVAQARTAYDHSQDNTQAHSDYLLNNADDDNGGFTLTVGKIAGVNTTPDASHDTGLLQTTITETSSATGHIYRGAFVDIDYTYDNVSGLDNHVIRGLELDIDLITLNAAATAHVPQLIKGVVTGDTATVFGTSSSSGTTPIFLSVESSRTTQAFSEGAIIFKVTAAGTSGNVICTRSSAGASGSGALTAYQGYADLQGTYSGEAKAVQGFIFTGASAAPSAVVAFDSLPNQGTPPALGITMAYRGSGGHWLASQGSLWVTSTARSTASAVTTTHLSAATAGQGYFEGAVEIDGTTYMDGPLAHSGSTLGVFGATPTTQTAAYTQTYATATRTHANPTGATLTDSSGGTADQTVSAVVDSGNTTDNSIINDNFAEMADEINKLVADMANVKQVLNQVIDDFQGYGHLQ